MTRGERVYADRLTYPKVVATIDIPLDKVAVALGEEGLEAVLLSYATTLLVAALLVFLIMAMFGVELWGSSAQMEQKS